MTDEGGWCWPGAGGIEDNPEALVLPPPPFFNCFTTCPSQQPCLEIREVSGEGWIVRARG